MRLQRIHDDRVDPRGCMLIDVREQLLPQPTPTTDDRYQAGQ